MRIPVAGWVAPFGDPGINDRSHLPRAFRSVPRPSSPLSAKASTRCPSLRLSATPNGNDHEARPRTRSGGVGRMIPRGPFGPRTRSVAKAGGQMRQTLLLQKTLRAGSRQAAPGFHQGRPRSPAVTQLASLRLPTTIATGRQRDPRRNPRLAAASVRPGGAPNGGAPVEVIGIEPTTSCLQSRRSPG